MSDPRSKEILDAVEKINAVQGNLAMCTVNGVMSFWTLVTETVAYSITPDEILKLAKQIQEQQK